MAYDFDGFRLDLERRRLSYGGTPVRLTAKALDVLAVLAERAPNVVSRAEFEAVVWPEGFIEPANLTQTIYMIRKALARYGKPPIETINGRGYRLSSDVLPVETPPRNERDAAPAGVGERLRAGWRALTSLAALL